MFTVTDGLSVSSRVADSSTGSELVMSIGNQKFGMPRKYHNQIGIWYFCPKFLGIFWYFIGILLMFLLKFG